MAIVLLAAFAAEATATSPSDVVSGQVSEFADVNQDIGGHATLVRRADGTTFVTVHVDGLTPGGTYASHVHLQACDDNKAGGHYKHDPAGDATPPNELWPGNGPFTATGGGTANVHATAPWIAGPSAMSVVVHDVDAGGAKVACADLA
ncbi:MAG TPA: hypothetical protein VGA36_05505 [Nitriliruptorales bacterium]